MFELAVEQWCVVNHKAVGAAARGGHVEIIAYIGYIGSLCSLCACTGASKGGKLEVLKWLFPDARWFPNQKQISTMLVRNAVIGGFLPVVEWAHKKGHALDIGLLGTAATYGQFDLVKFIQLNQAQPAVYPISAILHAALSANLETLVWLRERGYVCF